MTNQSYQNPHAQHERELAQTIARESIEILYGPKEEPNQRGGCLIIAVTAVLVVVAAIIVGWLL